MSLKFSLFSHRITTVSIPGVWGLTRNEVTRQVSMLIDFNH